MEEDYQKKCKKLEQEIKLLRSASGQWQKIQKLLQTSNKTLKTTQRELVIARNNAEAATKAKASFLASMSHEIRTPMNGVIGMTSLLENTLLNDEQHEFVSTIRTCGESLLTIINDILDFSKIESGKMELENEPLSLTTLIEDVFALLAEKVSEKQLDLLYLIEKDVPLNIYGDSTRLRQIIVNLINNAIKFTEKGEVFINVKIRQPIIAEKFILEFAVRDSGIGIPEAKLDTLFKAFSQVDASTTRKYGGTGLGLIISKKLSEAMGGKIWVDSEDGVGSTFSFEIVTSEAPPITREYNNSEIPELTGLKVVIVDDNTTNLKILKLLCQHWGMIVTQFSTAKETLKYVENNASSIDLLISDYHMPIMDGGELIREIRKKYSKKELPVVLLSSVNDVLKELQKMFNANLMKPVKQGKLFDTLISVASGVDSNSSTASVSKNSIQNISKEFPLRILVAEDNRINQKLVLKMLQKMGYMADIAGNGIEVLDILGIRITEHSIKAKYDMIFMDCQMPEMDGYEATKEIREFKDSSFKQPIIVAMTANAMQGDKEICLNAGMDDYISKPISPKAIRDVIIAISSENRDA